MLTVVAMKGWTRGMVWEDTGLKWIPTSPNIPTIGAARGYTATGVLGEIGIETGIGGPAPFQIVAGNDWNTSDVARRFNALHVAGVHASTCRYQTTDGKWAGSSYNGVYLKMDPHAAGNLSAINFQVIEILEEVVDDFSPFAHTIADQRDMFDKVSGGTTIRRQLVRGAAAADIVRSWNSGVVRWAQERLPYLLYGMTPAHPDTATGAIATSSTSAATTP
jgi:uncharacterized protein YbbC (DUF1343 family)